jgi:transposase
MKWTEALYGRIAHLLPKQRGNVVVSNLVFLQALQYMVENGCQWRALPSTFGKWSTIYQRFRRWIDKGIFDRLEKELQLESIDIQGVKVLALDSTYIKVHPNGTGAPQKRGLNPSARVAVV